MEFLKSLPWLSWEEVIVGILGSGHRHFDGCPVHTRTVGCCAQKKKLGFIVVVDKEQRNKLLKTLCHRTWYKDPELGIRGQNERCRERSAP